MTRFRTRKYEWNVEARPAVKRLRRFGLGAVAAIVLTAVVVTAVYAQEKYSLKSPSGIAFSDFRGYEDWSVVSSARTDEALKVIVANPTMIKAYKSGIPGNGQPFPDGSKIAKLQDVCHIRPGTHVCSLIICIADDGDRHSYG